jgi:hypothetical protein
MTSDALTLRQRDGANREALNRRLRVRSHSVRERRTDSDPASPADWTRRWTRRLSTSFCAAVIVVSGAVGQKPAEAIGADPAVSVQDPSSAQRARLDDAMARFKSAGLSLPDVEIVFTADASACAGHLGAFRSVEHTPHITVCSDLEFVLLHELAHVWIDANADDATRHRYLQVRGLDTWSDRTVPWRERGVEDAAFVIQQNLRDVAPSVLASATWMGRIQAFELLTDRRSPLRPRTLRSSVMERRSFNSCGDSCQKRTRRSFRMASTRSVPPPGGRAI